MGRVVVSAKIENVIDLYALSKRQIEEHEVRRVEVSDAIVDTGATLVGMPKRLIDQLGIEQIRTSCSDGDRNGDVRHLWPSAAHDRRTAVLR